MPESTGDFAAPDTNLDSTAVSATPALPLVPDGAGNVASRPGTETSPQEPGSVQAPPAGHPVTEGASPQPPRPLAPGTFLGGTFEIKQVLMRGTTNFYMADAGDWGQSDLRLLGERLAPPESFVPHHGPTEELFPLAERFMQDGREYAVWPRSQLLPLQEWRPAPNDDTLLEVLRPLATGLAALEAAGLVPHLDDFWSGEALFIDGAGQLRYYGFFDDTTAKSSGAATAQIQDSKPLDSVALDTLARLAERLVRKNLSHGATLRLDNEFASLPFAEETKAFLRRLTERDMPGVAAAARELDQWAPLDHCVADLLTDVGRQRELNEDCGLLLRLHRVGHAGNTDLDLLAVADGMGGHEGGEIASALALSSLQSSLLSRMQLDWLDNSAVRAGLLEMLDEANAAVVRLNEEPPYSAMRHKPGSTLVFAVRAGNRLFLGNAGDSRAYSWNEKGGLRRLTRDHSYVQDLIDGGRLAPEDAWNHPDSSVITSHIGMPRGFHREIFQYLLAPADRIVLVSDGVVDMLPDQEIERIVAAATTPREMVQGLVSAANEAGGADNITVATLFVH